MGVRKKPVDQPTRKTRAAYNKALDTFRQRRDVSGIDIGYRYDADGRAVGEPTVRIHYFESGEPERRGMAPAPARKAAGTSPRVIDGVELFSMSATYVLHVGPRTPQDPINPLQPGVSVSHQRTAGGTLGLIVFDAAGKPCIVSNHHVLVPDDAPLADDNIVVQPAASVHEIGFVIRGMLDLDGDAAIARLNGSRRIKRAQFRSNVVLRAAADAELGDMVEKSGLRTGVTRGIVDGIGRYFMSPADRAGMDGFRIVCVRTPGGACKQDLSGMGDSGAVWYRKKEKQGVGLHVGGDPAGQNVAIACHLTRVIRRFGVSLLPPTRRN